MLSTLLAVAILCILAILLVILLTFAAYQTSRKRIGYIPLPARAVPKVIEALELNGSGTLIDLGCGDGRILEAACAANPSLKARGIEINPIVVGLAWWRLRKLSMANVKLDDIKKTPLHSARWIFTYLSHGQMAELEPKCDAEMSKGSRVVSCDFPFPNRKPAQTLKIGEKWQLGQTLYIYHY